MPCSLDTLVSEYQPQTDSHGAACPMQKLDLLLFKWNKASAQLEAAELAWEEQGKKDRPEARVHGCCCCGGALNFGGMQLASHGLLSRRAPTEYACLHAEFLQVQYA